MKVLITGGTGFVGTEVIEAVVQAGHDVRALVRPGSEKKLPPGIELEIASGDVTDPAGLAEAAAGVAAAIHLVGVIREFPRRGITFEKLHLEATINVIAALKEAGVKRYLHLSALGARPDSASPYHRTKAAAEAEVRASGLKWTIFRPSLIFGPRDLSINIFARQVRTWPLVPVIGSGEYRLQPVSVTTVAQGLAKALTIPETIGQSLDVTGPKAYTYNELLRAIGRVIGKRPKLIHLPVWPIRLAAVAFGGWAAFPLTAPQLDMLLEGNAAEADEFYRLLDLTPIPLEAGLADYLK